MQDDGHDGVECAQLVAGSLGRSRMQINELEEYLILIQTNYLHVADSLLQEAKTEGAGYKSMNWKMVRSLGL